MNAKTSIYITCTCTQLTSWITPPQTVCNGVELVVVSPAAAIDERQTCPLTPVVVEGRYGRPTETSLRGKGARVNACTQRAKNISSA
jgi:hypothetical protein